MTLVFREAYGSEVKSEVDALYKRVNSVGRARDNDYFFLAFENSTLVGAVRYCVEEQTAMLRTMMIDADFRGRGIGMALLRRFASYLERNSIHDVYCLPYPHLKEFYGSVGFELIEANDAPVMLQERMETYRQSGTLCLCMKRK